MRQGLHRLAEAHIIGQHTAQSGTSQELQPVHPLLLVGPQRGFESIGQGGTRDGAARIAQSRP